MSESALSVWMLRPHAWHRCRVPAGSAAKSTVHPDPVNRSVAGDCHCRWLDVCFESAAASAPAGSMASAGATVRAYDPEAMHETARIYGTRDDLDLVGTREEALKGADALIIATEWKVFQSADFETISKSE